MTDIGTVVVNHWNDAITILTLLIALWTGYHQIRHYQSQRPSIEINDIENSRYDAVAIEGIGFMTEVDPMVRSDINHVKYQMKVTVENGGREPFTISDIRLALPNRSEDISLSPDNRELDETGYFQIEGNQRDRLDLSGSSDERDEYPQEIHGTLIIDSTAGIVRKPVVLVHGIESS